VASLFISHSSSDRDAAQRLAKRLRDEDFAALFLDFDPDLGIPAGGKWEREFYVQLRKSDALIFQLCQALEEAHSSLRMRLEIVQLATNWEQVDLVNETITKRPVGLLGRTAWLTSLSHTRAGTASL
jgi:hypothetical protein